VAIQIEQQDTLLGRWTLARWTPRALGWAVEGAWYFEGSLTRSRERHFPRGTVELVVHLGPVYGRVHAERVEPFSSACLSGLLLGSEVIEAPPGPSAVLGVRLRPLGAYALLGRPLDELTDLTVDLADVMPGTVSELEDRCRAGGTPEERVRIAREWIRERLLGGAEPDPAVAWGVREIERRAGAVSIGDLRDRTGWSKTRFTSVFREQTGVTPKLLARIHRFRTAMEMVNRGDTSLVDVALACGYYDQPHLNGEFRELSGYSPGEYLGQMRFPESVSVAEGAS
jgi:AraC-like DNA-binding protein